MTKYKISILILVLISLASIVFAGGIFRFGGSNQNTIINSYTFMPHEDTIVNFGHNLTIRVNVTDLESDYIPNVNFTLISPTGYHYLNHSNGTQFSDYWNSTYFGINETGTWTWKVVSEDNITINITRASINGSFTITDEVYIIPNDIEITIPNNYNFSDLIKLYTNSREPLNFTLSHTFSDITITLNETYLMINSTQYTKFNLTISSNSSSSGTYYGNITLTRNSPYDSVYNMSIKVSISATYGDAEFDVPTDAAYGMCVGSVDYHEEVINNGNYTLTNCRPYLYLPNGTVVKNGTTIPSIVPSDVKTAENRYEYTGGDVELYFAVECTASAGGSLDKTSNDPKLTFVDNCPPGGTTPGGPGGPPTPPISFAAAVVNATIPSFCGDGKCDAGETPFGANACREDCPINLDVLFSWGEGGAIRQAWFASLIVWSLLGLSFIAVIRRQITLQNTRKGKKKKINILNKLKGLFKR